MLQSRLCSLPSRGVRRSVACAAARRQAPAVVRAANPAAARARCREVASKVSRLLRLCVRRRRNLRRRRRGEFLQLLNFLELLQEPLPGLTGGGGRAGLGRSGAAALRRGRRRLLLLQWRWLRRRVVSVGVRVVVRVRRRRRAGRRGERRVGPRHRSVEEAPASSASSPAAADGARQQLQTQAQERSVKEGRRAPGVVVCRRASGGLDPWEVVVARVARRGVARAPRDGGVGPGRAARREVPPARQPRPAASDAPAAAAGGVVAAVGGGLRLPPVAVVTGKMLRGEVCWRRVARAVGHRGVRRRRRAGPPEEGRGRRRRIRGPRGQGRGGRGAPAACVRGRHSSTTLVRRTLSAFLCFTVAVRSGELAKRRAENTERASVSSGGFVVCCAVCGVSVCPRLRSIPYPCPTDAGWMRPRRECRLASRSRGMNRGPRRRRRRAPHRPRARAAAGGAGATVASGAGAAGGSRGRPRLPRHPARAARGAARGEGEQRGPPADTCTADGYPSSCESNITAGVTRERRASESRRSLLTPVLTLFACLHEEIKSGPGVDRGGTRRRRGRARLGGQPGRRRGRGGRRQPRGGRGVLC